jgi:hypothetical protein
MSIPRLQGANIYRTASAVLFCAALLLPCCEVRSKIPMKFAGYQCAGLTLFAAFFVTHSVILNAWAAGSLLAGIRSVPPSLVACAVSVVTFPAFGVYISLAFTPYFPRVRRAFAVLAVVCSSASVVVFLKSDFHPAIGWYVGMLSILLSITPEVLPGMKLLKNGLEAS